MSIQNFVGRESATTKLENLLLGQSQGHGKLIVQSIDGPGGIGKTSLFDYALAGTDISARKYLTLRVDGNEAMGLSLARLICRMVDNAAADVIKEKPAGFYFPSVARVVKTIDEIRNQAIVEFAKKHPDDENGRKKLAAILDALLDTGKAINDVVPATKKRIDFREIEKVRPSVDKAILTLDSLKLEPISFLEKIGIGSSRTLRNAIRENACRPLADAMVADLSAILDSYKKEDRFRAAHKKIHGIDRLLLVIDDYEMVQGAIGEFLVGSLLPSLKNASFETVAIILGRDQLRNTHPAWDQHLEPCMQRSISVTSLSKPEMERLISSYDIISATEKERAWRDTEGYPFYVQLWIEEAESGGRSAVMLKRFHDRTTRWMTARQKMWLQRIIFIDTVNISSLSHVFETQEEVEAAFEWFKNEGSVRDPSGTEFKVRAYLRSRLLDYLQITDPDWHSTLKAKSAAHGLMAE